MFHRRRALQFAGLTFCSAAFGRATRAADIAVRTRNEVTTILLDDKVMLSYVTQDEKISHPYFHSLKAADGTQVSRNHPPQSGDLTDHDLYHPGLWLAFGDVSGHDTWRLKNAVQHKRISDPSLSTVVTAGVTKSNYKFTSSNSYLDQDKEEYVRESTTYSFTTRQGGWLLSMSITLEGHEQELTFGDQEEMGLGVRLATPLIVKNGGTIRNSVGGKDEKGCWGKAAEWCDYSGVIAKKRYGILMMPHPENFKPSSFHVRDYGLMVANPFAEQAFGRGKAAKTIVKPGESLRLRFAVLVYGLADEKPIDAAAELKNYVGDKP